MATPEMEQAQFVFGGTVVRVKAATMTVPDKNKTAVVHVDRIVRGPEVLTGHAGTDVTVQLAKGERVKPGQRAVFYTNGWLFGEGLAVQSVGHEAAAKRSPAATMATAAPSAAPAPAKAANEREIAKRAAAAPLVVTGKVVAVGLPGESLRATAAVPSTPPPVTEHDPFWSEAVVEVQSTHKGDPRRTVVVRFPSSTDVKWYRAPKFQVGQEGVFLLHDDATSRAALGAVSLAMAETTSEPTYTCLNSADFLPAHHVADVETAIQASTGNA